MVLPLHILGGIFALLFGYTALFAAKGGTLHRKAGLGFVIAMIVMSLSGAGIAAFNGSTASAIAGSLTFYFVVTGLLTVKRVPGARQLEMLAMGWGLILGLFAIRTGLWLVPTGRPETVPMFIFAAVSISAAMGDFRMLRAGGIEGRARLERHLWRVCFGMWVAAASFFWGPPGRVPEIIRIPVLLPIPVLAPIGVMSYWLWKMRRRRNAPALTTREQTADVMP